MGEAMDGFTVTFKTLSYGKSQFTNATFLFTIVVICSFVFVYAMIWASIKIGLSDSIASKFASFPIAFLTVSVPIILYYILRSDLVFSFGSCWQADYFAFYCIIIVTFFISLYKYTTPGTGASQGFWSGTFKFSLFTLYSLTFSPVFVWSVGAQEDVFHDGVLRTMGLLIVIIQFLMVGFLTKFSVLTSVFPIVTMNGAVMFYYQMWPYAIKNGVMLNGTVFVYLIGNYISGIFISKQNSKLTASLYTMLVFVYFASIMFFWPALSMHYTDSFHANDYTEFHMSSFDPRVKEVAASSS